LLLVVVVVSEKETILAICAIAGKRVRFES
jgi:hypothetical protein